MWRKRAMFQQNGSGISLYFIAAPFFYYVAHYRRNLKQKSVLNPKCLFTVACCDNLGNDDVRYFGVHSNEALKPLARLKHVGNYCCSKGGVCSPENKQYFDQHLRLHRNLLQAELQHFWTERIVAEFEAKETDDAGSTWEKVQEFGKSLDVLQKNHQKLQLAFEKKQVEVERVESRIRNEEKRSLTEACEKLIVQRNVSRAEMKILDYRLHELRSSFAITPECLREAKRHVLEIQEKILLISEEIKSKNCSLSEYLDCYKSTNEEISSLQIKVERLQKQISALMNPIRGADFAAFAVDNDDTLDEVEKKVEIAASEPERSSNISGFGIFREWVGSEVKDTRAKGVTGFQPESIFSRQKGGPDKTYRSTEVDSKNRELDKSTKTLEMLQEKIICIRSRATTMIRERDERVERLKELQTSLSVAMEDVVTVEAQALEFYRVRKAELEQKKEEALKRLKESESKLRPMTERLEVLYRITQTAVKRQLELKNEIQGLKTKLQESELGIARHQMVGERSLGEELNLTHNPIPVEENRKLLIDDSQRAVREAEEALDDLESQSLSLVVGSCLTRSVGPIEIPGLQILSELIMSREPSTLTMADVLQHWIHVRREVILEEERNWLKYCVKKRLTDRGLEKALDKCMEDRLTILDGLVGKIICDSRTTWCWPAPVEAMEATTQKLQKVLNSEVFELEAKRQAFVEFMVQLKSSITTSLQALARSLAKEERKLEALCVEESSARALLTTLAEDPPIFQSELKPEIL